MNDPTTLERGRRVYNARCYFCHGYQGDGRTVAAVYLEPRPRDFTRAQDLTLEATLAAIRQGRPGTAMQPFSGLLSAAEMADVAAFVQAAFVRCQETNTAYHTAANGWPDHDRRYGAAFPFVRGELSAATAETALDPRQQLGRQLFLENCITCHEPRVAPRSSSVVGSWDLLPAPPALSLSRPALPDHDEPYDARGHHDDHKDEHDNDEHGEDHEEYGEEYASCGDGPGHPPQITDMTRPEAQGAELYAENCAFCHADDGRGTNWIGCFLEPHPTDLTEPTAYPNSAPEALARTIRDGVAATSMPGFGAVLTDAQVTALVAYLRRAFLSPAQ